MLKERQFRNFVYLIYPLSSNSHCYQISSYNPGAIFINQRDHAEKLSQDYFSGYIIFYKQVNVPNSISPAVPSGLKFNDSSQETQIFDIFILFYAVQKCLD